MGSKVTIEQVAQHSGVSLATVSRVLNHPELVSSKTAARVNASIRELNYSSVVGQYNSAEFEGGAGLIMVNIPWLDNPFYSEIVRGIRVAARSAGFDVLVSWDVPTASAVNDYCAMLRRCNANGIITLSPLEAETIERIDSTIPLVQCCEVNPEVDVPFVTIDDFAAARIAVEHLVSCGCSRLAIVSGPDTYKYARGRMDGFLSVAKAHGIDIEDGWIVCVPDNSYGLAHSAVCHMLESANAPDGVFACSDTYGAAVISAARWTYGSRRPHGRGFRQHRQRHHDDAHAHHREPAALSYGLYRLQHPPRTHEGRRRAAVNDHGNRACGARIHHAVEGITKSASG